MSETIKQAAIGDAEDELAGTRRLLERVPEEHFDWRPHPRSRSLRELATHVATLPRLQATVLLQDGLDIAAPRPPSPEPHTSAELLDIFDGSAAMLRDALVATDDAALMQTWTLRNGDEVRFSMPKIAAIRRMGLSHMIHHRAQLTVYLRLLEVPVPGLYGPSADEKAG